MTLLKSQLGRNVFTNYLAVIWMGGLSILLIPFYLGFLGPQQWGVVSICMALQAFFNLLDAGLSQIMPRDIARVANDPSVRLKTFIVYQRTYFLLALCGFTVGQMTIPWLVNHWFGGGRSLSSEDIWAFHLVVLQFLFQFLNNSNIGYWNGMQSQAKANLRQCIFGSLKHVGALSLAFFWNADAISYLIPFAIISILEFLLNRLSIATSLKNLTLCQIKWADYKKLGQEAGVLFLGVLIGMLASQMDRIVLSKYVDVTAFGIYAIVANLGLAVLQLQSPLIRAFLPRITQDLAGNNDPSFKWLSIGISLLCILPCLILALLSPLILRFWIGNPEVVSSGAIPLSLFFCAVAFNSIYQLIYQRILIAGHGKWVAIINGLTIIFALPLLLVTVSSLGIISGGIYWVAMTFMQAILGLIWFRFKAR